MKHGLRNTYKLTKHCQMGGGRCMQVGLRCFFSIFFLLIFCIGINAQTASISGNATVCLNTTNVKVTFSATGGSAPYTFTYTINGETPAYEVTSPTGAAVSIDVNTSQEGAFVYQLLSFKYGNNTIDPGGQSVTINVVAPLTISSQPQPLTRALGCSASFSVVASGTGPFTYQWKKNGAEIDGAVSGNLNINSVTASDAGSYTVEVTNGCGEKTSDAAALSIAAPLIAGTFNTNSVESCVGYHPIFNTTPASGGSGSYQYQWLLNGTAILGATLADYDAGQLLAAGTYTFSRSVTDGCQTVTTASKTITIVADPTLTISGSADVCQSETTTLTAVITGGTGTMIPKWQKASSNVTPTWEDIGVTALTYNPPTDVPGIYYYRAFLDPNVGSCNQASATYTLTVNAPPKAPTASNQEVCATSPLQTLAASATAPGSSIVWYSAATGGTIVANPALNTVGTVTYYAASKDNATNCESATRTAVTLTIKAAPTAPTPGVNQVVCANSPVQTLTATATASGSTIVWYDASTGGTMVSGPILNAVGSVTYYAAAKDNANQCESNSRTAVILTINDRPAVPTSGGDQTVCVLSNPQTLTATATVSSGTVIWYDAATGGNVVSNPILNTIGTKTYYAAARDNSTSCESASRISVTLTINALPTAFAVTGGGAYCAGDAGVDVGLFGSQTGVSYQLYKDGVVVGTAITGTGGAIAFGKQTAAGSYTVVATNTSTNCVATMTGSVSVTINPLPTATAGSNSPVCEKSNLQLSASGGVSYSWTGPGFTSNQQNPVINSVTSAAAGTYTVNVTDANGCKNTASTTVTTIPTVTPSVIINASPGSTICAGTSVTFTATPTNGGTAPIYQWKVNGNNVGTNSPTYTTSTLNNADKVTVVLTSNAVCPSPATVTSNEIPMTVNAKVIPSVSIGASANSICPGTTVSFDATGINGGNAPAYQWFLNGNPVGTGGTSFSSSTLNSGDVVKVVMTSSAICPTSATAESNSETITLKPVPVPSVSITSSINNICPDNLVSFTATPVNGGTTPKYQWQVNGVSVGSNSPTFSSTTLNNSDVVSVILTSNATCANPTMATATGVTMVVKPGTPATPGVITGASPVCPGVTGSTYSIATVTNATGYTWTVPAGWSITAGQGTPSITVTSGATGQNGNITVTASNDCGTSAAKTLAVTVSPGTPATPSIITGPTELCLNSSNIKYSIAAVPNATSYTWSVPTGWTISAGQGSTSITIATNGTAASGNVSVIATNSCGSSSAQMTAVIVRAGAPAVPQKPSGPDAVCPVEAGLVYTIPAVTGATTYNWTLPSGWTITSGAGTTSITVTAGGGSATGLQDVLVSATNACGTSQNSLPMGVTVNTFAAADAGPDVAICSTESTANLVGAVEGAVRGNSGVWTTSGSGSFGSPDKLTTTYTPSAQDKLTGYVTITFTVTPGGKACAGVFTDQMILTIRKVPTASIAGATTICEGSSTNITFTATPNTTVSYTKGGTPQTIDVGQSGSAVLNTSGLSSTTTYSLVSVAYTTAPGCSSPAAGSATVTVNKAPTITAGGPDLICQSATPGPITLAGASFTNASTAAWSITSGTGTLSSTAQTSGPSAVTFTPTANFSGTIELTLTTNAPTPCAAVSAKRIITINPAPTVNAGADDVACQSATPTAIPLTGATIGGSASSGTWSIVSGGGSLSSTSASTNPGGVTYTPAANYTGPVVLMLTSNATSPCVAATDTKTITINAGPTVSAGVAQTICSNTPATMNGAFGGGASSGMWGTSGSGTFSNNTPTAVYTPSNGDINAGSVTLTYTTDDPAGPCGPVSASMVLTIKKAVVITNQPINTAVCAGMPADLHVTAIGDGLTYQWYKGTSPGGTAVVNSSNITGATSANLHFNQAALSDDGSYYVVVSGAAPCAPAVSEQRTLNVDKAINITTQPASQTLCTGTSYTFSVVADANGDALSYQWRKNGVNIDGETGASLTLTNISLTDAGSYDVVITGPTGYTCSSRISTPGVLTVNDNATISLSSAVGTDGQTKCVDNAITPITYTIGGGGTGASITAGSLPAGVTGSYNNGVFTISGKPMTAGTFNYTVTTTGPCNNTAATGTITVNDNSTLTLTSNNATQPVCASGPITAITYNVGGGATGVNVTGLPGGVTGTLNNGVFTISGNPTVPGTYPFTVTTTGPCINPTLNGTITVNPNSTLSLSSLSADQRLCVNSVPTNITYAVGGGATGATITGLPPGMTGVYSNGVFTISNTPTAAGTYNYTVTTTGTCNNKSLSGTIIVDPAPFGGTLSPAITTVCGTPNSGTISLTGQSGNIIRWESSTNGGGTWTTVNNTTATLSYSNITQTTLYRAVIQSGVCPLAYSLNAVVSVIPATQPTATTSPSEICVGQTANLAAASGLPQTWQDIDATFNQANPAGWRITQNGTVINFPANADNASTFPWSETNGPKTPFNGGVTYNNLQTDGKFAIASGIVNTTMETPVFSTIGMTAAVLKFYQALVFAAGASGKIEISTDGGATYNKTLVQYNGPMTIGNPASSWDPLNIDLSNYIGLSNLRIRFTYTGADNSNWAIDGLNLQPPGPTLTYNWTLTNPSGVPSPYYLNATNQQNVTATPPAPGTYTYQVATTIGSCPGGTASVVVTVRALPVITPVNSCVGGGTVTFSQTGGASGGTWSISGGGTINSSTGAFTPSAAGCFTVTYKTPGPGCTDTKSFVVFPAAPVLSAPANTCNTAFALPTVTAVNGFSVQYSINSGTWSALPTLPTTPGCYFIQARYVLATACGTNAVGTVSPGCVSNTVNVVIFPTAPAPVVNSGCGPIVVTPPASVSGFNVQYSFDDGATWGANTPPTADNCTGYKIKVRYVTSAACGTIAAGTAAPAGCESPSVTRKVDNTKPTVTCPTVQPVCVLPGNSYTIPPLTASDNCSANGALTITYSITGATMRSGTGVDASGTFNIGVSTIIWTVVDECGNSNTCSTQVTINPKPTPTIYHN